MLGDTTVGKIKIPEYELSDEIMFVNHQENEQRSGHLGHALVEYEPNKILAFYSNTDGNIKGGHNCIGWVEYKRSEDGGQTWSKAKRLKASTDSYLNGTGYIACEKAALAPDGTIVLFCYRSVPDTEYYGPNMIPLYLTSKDGGETWSEPKELGTLPGRVFATVVRDGEIFVMMRVDLELYKEWKTGDPVYVLYKSTDNGATFKKHGNVTDVRNRYYGSMIVTPEGKLRVYLYTESDEKQLHIYESKDGRRFTYTGISVCEKKIRNPQITYYKGLYFLHGRSGNDGPYFVLYTSTDGLKWDKGTYIDEVVTGSFGGSCYYSNNLIVNGEKILIQYSDNYEGARTNIKHRWITFKTAD